MYVYVFFIFYVAKPKSEGLYAICWSTKLMFRKSILFRFLATIARDFYVIFKPV